MPSSHLLVCLPLAFPLCSACSTLPPAAFALLPLSLLARDRHLRASLLFFCFLDSLVPSLCGLRTPPFLHCRPRLLWGIMYHVHPEGGERKEEAVRERGPPFNTSVTLCAMHAGYMSRHMGESRVSVCAILRHPLCGCEKILNTNTGKQGPTRSRQLEMAGLPVPPGLEGILDLVARPPAAHGDGAPPDGRAAHGGGAPPVGQAPEDFDPDLAQLVALAAPVRGAPVYQQRSLALMAHARGEKRNRQLVAALEQERHRNAKLARDSAVVKALHPSLCRAICLPPSSKLSPDDLAIVQMRLAASRKMRGKHLEPQGKVQAATTRAVATVLAKLQAGHIDELRRPPPAVARLAGPRVRQRVFVMAAQWDETSQKLAPLLTAATSSARRSRMQVQAQVMVINGAVSVFTASQAEHGITVSVESSPWRVRPLRLEGTNADFLLEAVLRSLPIDLRTRDALHDLCCNNDWCVFTMVLDRASANFAACRWLCGLIAVEFRVKTCLFWMEPCAAHGVSLVKCRAKVMKDLSAALYSMTRWMRIAHNQDMLVNSMKRKLSDLVVVLDRPRPDGDREESLGMVELIYGSMTSSFLWRKTATGKEKTQFHQDLEELCNLMNLHGTSTQIFTWNRVAEGSHEHIDLGLPVGAKIYADDAVCKDKVINAILKLMFGRAWVAATLSRWTNVGTTIRRCLLGVLCGKILPETIEDVKLGMELTDDLESALARVVEADRNDYAARNKLRLIRISRVLSGPDLAWHLAVLVVCSAPVDRLLYQILGHDRERVSLADLVHPTSSPLVGCQNRLFSLAATFDFRDESPWLLLMKVGADIGRQAVRRFARRQILQLSAGIMQVFELRMSGDVYRACWLSFDDLPQEVQIDALRTLYDEPPDCHSFFLFQLRQAYTSPAELARAGPTVLRAWLHSTETSIDFSERVHAQFRTDLMTPGPASGFSQACDRLLVRQLVVEHVRRGGLDPALTPMFDSPPTTSSDDSPWTSGRAGQGGSAYMEFHNRRLQVWKALTSPDMPMSEQERAEAEQKIRDDWQVVRADETQYENWLRISKANRGPGQIVASCSSGTPAAAPFRGLWSLSDDPRHLVPPAELATHLAREKRTSKNERDCMVADGNLVVSPVPSRLANTLPHLGSVHGCRSSLKNICRLHGAHPRDRLGAMDRLCSRLSRWVDSLAVDVRFGAEALLLCKGCNALDAAPDLAMAVLLVHPSGKPKVQFFAKVALVLGDNLHEECAPRAPPYTLEIMSGTNRMAIPNSEDPAVQSLTFCTSDELALALVTARPVWQFYPLEYTIGEESLLSMEVSSEGQVIQPPPQTKRRSRVQDVELPDVLDLGDPFAYGRAQAERARSSTPSAPPSPAAGATVDAADTDSDDDAPPAPFSEDVFEEQSDTHGIPAVLEDDVESDEPEAMGELDQELLDEAVGLIMDECDEPDIPALREDGLGEEERQRQEAIAGSSMDGEGYITTTVEP